MVSPLIRRRPPIRALAAGAALALSALALSTPSAANAATLGEQCSGTAIEGALASASSPQIVAQFLWAPSFNTSTNAKACSGKQGSKGKPKVRYEAAGVGLGAWGVDGHAFEAKRIAFAGTDEAPDAQQRSEIQSNSAHPAVNTLQTIPVLQEALAIVVHLPEGCKAASTAYPGRLVLDNLTLQKIFRHVIVKWSEITDDGDHLTGEKCNSATTITRIVREGPEAATSILKRYLGAVHPEHNVLGTLGWRELAAPTHNAEWPGPVDRASGDLAEASAVASTGASIGYADLAFARAQGSFTPTSGGAGSALFWAPIQDNGLGQKGETYSDPSTNGDSAETAYANCSETAYGNGESASPPASTLELWNEVSAKPTERAYSLCGLTYDLSFDEYSQYPGTTLGEATTANNYLSFELAPGGGQQLIDKHDYWPLPGSIRPEASAGAERTRY